jgi:hypothetical protein
MCNDGSIYVQPGTTGYSQDGSTRNCDQTGAVRGWPLNLTVEPSTNVVVDVDLRATSGTYTEPGGATMSIGNTDFSNTSTFAVVNDLSTTFEGGSAGTIFMGTNTWQDIPVSSSPQYTYSYWRIYVPVGQTAGNYSVDLEIRTQQG